MPGARNWRRIFAFLASVKLAIPLLVLIAASSIAGSLIPQGSNVRLAPSLPAWIHGLNAYLQLNDIFHSWWYLWLLALLGLSLLAITVRRLPTFWRQRGASAGLGILAAHVGVLLILGGVAYGSMNGFRYYIRLIEGEVTVVPSLPFVIKLDDLDIGFYPPESFGHRGPDSRVIERQNSDITLLHHGSPFLQGTAAPGRPISARGVTLLPATKDTGWVFDLVLLAGGKEKVVPIRPWAPPLITLGLGNKSRVLAHRLVHAEGGSELQVESTADLAAEIFLLQEDGSSRSLGFATQNEPVTYEAWTILVGDVRRHTGVHAYSRPEWPILVAGILTLIVGLAGYFTHWGVRLVPARFRFAGGQRQPREARPMESRAGLADEVRPG